jgi:hypothetical protein
VRVSDLTVGSTVPSQLAGSGIKVVVRSGAAHSRLNAAGSRTASAAPAGGDDPDRIEQLSRRHASLPGFGASAIGVAILSNLASTGGSLAHVALLAAVLITAWLILAALFWLVAFRVAASSRCWGAVQQHVESARATAEPAGAGALPVSTSIRPIGEAFASGSTTMRCRSWR